MTTNAMTSAERRAVASLSLLYIFRMLGLFMVLPVLALYAVDYAGSTPLLIGLALGIYGLSQAVLQVPLGMLSDRIGRKPVIVAGLLIFAFGSLIAAVADSMFGLIFGRFLQGAGAIASTVTALLADLTREQHRSKAMAAVGASIGLSFAIALILGPLLSAWLGLSGLFVVIGFLALLGIVIVLGIVPTPLRVSSDSESFSLQRLLGQCLRDAELMRLNIGAFVLHFMLMALFVVAPGLLESQGLARETHWQVYLPILLLSFVVMLPLMLAAERHRQIKSLLLGSVAVLTATPLMLWLAPDQPWSLLAGLLLFFIAFNLLEANLPSLVSKTIHADGKGTALGAFASFQFAGAFCGGLVGGAVMQFWGSTGVFAVFTLAGLGWLLQALPMKPPRQLNHLAIALGDSQNESDSLLAELKQLPGVIDITVLTGEQVAYLRVSEEFDTDRLSGFVIN